MVQHWKEAQYLQKAASTSQSIISIHKMCLGFPRKPQQSMYVKLKAMLSSRKYHSPKQQVNRTQKEVSSIAHHQSSVISKKKQTLRIPKVTPQNEKNRPTKFPNLDPETAPRNKVRDV